MAKLTLYQFKDCPYCAKVRAKLDSLELEYDKVNVLRNREDPIRKELWRQSGVPTVPVLKITDKNQPDLFIGESEKIIDYLQQHF